MEYNGKKILVCDCEHSMPIDGDKLVRACGAKGPLEVQTQLCRAQIDNFRAALVDGVGDIVVACTQEAPLFAEIHDEMGSERRLIHSNIRERAGWSADADAALPKIAALLAEATVEVPDAPTLTIESDGVCLVYGRDEVAFAAAERLSQRLDVTLLLDGRPDLLPPRVGEVPVFGGRIAKASGHFGAFELVVDDYAAPRVSSRAGLAFDPGRDGARSTCDLILDLSGGTPLFPAGGRRDGYYRVDPADPVAVERAIFDIADMVGSFEKPRYVAFEPSLCVHSRNRITGCHRCLDACPAGAIRPAGDTVEIDPHLCGGCGNCASVCPTGAAAYALPPQDALLLRLRTLLETYRKAGGESPVLLLVDEPFGEDMIAASSRQGRGLPANVLPFAVNEVTQPSFDFIASAFAYGITHLVILVPPKRRQESDSLAGQTAMIERLLDGLGYAPGAVVFLDCDDPERLEESLWTLTPRPGAEAGSFMPLGTKRANAALALGHLQKVAPAPADRVALPAGAPFGSVEIDVDGCTLCLSCVSTCPVNALRDDPDRPRLSFVENACVQCGLCVATCPEKVMRLEPRYDFTAAARNERLVKEEEPYECVRCGKEFGTRSSVERIVAALAGKHSMFRDPAAVERIRMCENCRVVVQFEAQDNPFAGAPRPKVRTTEDDLREREAEIEEARRKLLAERKGTDDSQT
ncbi:4Fe-4S binding protein [Oceanibacterium hippocampi]|uniref:NADH-plastoquinone oxidoreductase subunit n=1 Tax=Oceanibacterium hippocampi TaxID=745714 RepID=A0A1Y5TCD4_9PROT|nr:4Fe-4S binding protein [Oceanibacterium hippocampi]SLN60522.1 NADH-plastoquinone oxidoreductase subunit [Oceanibacterium hippocampi]